MQISGTIYHTSMHLDENKLERPTSCPFCNSDMRNFVYTLQENPQVVLLKCLRCRAISADRMPTDEALKEYYSSYYFSSPGSNEKITFQLPARFGLHLARNFLRLRNLTKVSILDFGGGDGTIAHWVAMELVAKGVTLVDITIIDYHDAPVIPHDSRISIQRKASLEHIDSCYDFVIASAVLEHIPNPRPILDKLLALVEEHGVFYARTPYMTPLIKLMRLVGIRFDFTYPGHVHDLGQDFWETYFTDNMQTKGFLMAASNPSLVETTFSKNPIRTLAAYVCKAPWYLLGKYYGLVGGWEIFAQRIPYAR